MRRVGRRSQPLAGIMSFSSDGIARLARLARIRLDEGEIDDVRDKLDAIFGLIDALQAIDTTGVVPMAHAQDANLPLRDDVVTAEDRRALYQAQAPEVADGLYIVPRVVE
jgi:aspartyl-tRNA(Asn)/glutamyl-tRNA(Gln) amidotransferase subunit C